MRTTQQRYWDNFLILRLFDAVSERSRVDGNIKAQKLAFLLELDGQKSGLAATHYRFFRYQLGPYSADLANDIKRLEDLGIVSKTTRALTSRGRFLHDYVLGSLKRDGLTPEARAALDLADNVAAEHGKKTGTALKSQVYDLTVPVAEYLGREERVYDVPMFMDILDPVHTQGLRDVQPLSDDLIEDLQSELEIPQEKLRAEHPSFQATVRRMLESIPN